MSADLPSTAAVAKNAFEQLCEKGWARVTRAQLGIPSEDVESAHVSIWDVAGAPYRKLVPSVDDPAWGTQEATSAFGGVGGFTSRQFIPEQVALQTHPAVEAFYRELFVQSGHLVQGNGRYVYKRPDNGDYLFVPDERDPDEAGGEPVVLFHTYAERANITLPGALQDIVGQKGAKPHIDTNPWAPDYGDGSVVVDPTEEAKKHYMHRRWEIERPFQSFIALTDCSGGPLAGGMGVSTGSHETFKKLQKLPAHGRNPRWGNLVRMTPRPGGAWRDEAQRGEREEVDELHDEILKAMHFPIYKAGDMIVWNRETTHTGCERNFTKTHQARVYVNKLPLCKRNDSYVKLQAEKATQGAQVHGKSKDRNEKVDPDTLTEYQRAVLGFLAC